MASVQDAQAPTKVKETAPTEITKAEETTPEEPKEETDQEPKEATTTDEALSASETEVPVEVVTEETTGKESAAVDDENKPAESAN